MTGILLLAMGHKHYAEMACNLAMSLRTGAPNVSITLAWHGYNPQQLSPQKQKLFNGFVQIPDSYLLKEGAFRPFRVKTLLNKLTPYQNTLYLDADIIFYTNSVNTIIDELMPHNFSVMNWGAEVLQKDKKPLHDNAWAATVDVAEAYNLWGKTYCPTHSELIWFKQCESTEAMFALANEIFDKPKVKTWTFAGDVPDEFAFNVALSALNIQPHKMPWRKFWWEKYEADRKIRPEDISKHFAGMSMAGSANPITSITRYNAILRYAAQKAGIENYWKYVPKRRWAAERAGM